jgi:hypothetical protein
MCCYLFHQMNLYVLWQDIEHMLVIFKFRACMLRYIAVSPFENRDIERAMDG